MTKQVQDALRSSSRWKVWEPVFWLLALASPFVLSSHALIINEIAISLMMSAWLDSTKGEASASSQKTGSHTFQRLLLRRAS